jgi:CheY-like chemotaxis protein
MGTERILIVEDDDDLLEVTSETLTSLGYQVSHARDGVEALRILRSGQHFELLLSDIVMPSGVNGVELAREARRLNKGIKTLLTSGHAANVLQRHDALGEYPIVEKPFSPSGLGRRVRAILDEPAPPTKSVALRRPLTKS